MGPGRRRAQLTPEQRARVEARLRGNKSSAVRIPRRNPHQRIPLSFSQDRMWNWDLIPIESPLHNAPSVLRIRGRFDPTRFARALDHVIQRHESLRFVFASDEQGAAQRPLRNVSVPVDVQDLAGAAEEERQEKTRELAAEQSRTPFDLARGPLLRTVILRFAEDDYAVLLTLHHLVFDGWSKGVLVRELLAQYVGGASSELPEMPIQFGDFAVWQRGEEGSRAAELEVEYWVGQLANTSVWDFPFQRRRPRHPTFEGRRRWLQFSPELSEQVRREADRAGATLFMVLIATWAAYCARLTGRKDITVGSLVAGRTVPETEPLIGFFVNYLPLKIDCSGSPSFRELVQRVRRLCLEGYEHQAAPFQAIVERLGVGRDSSRHPIFSTAFTLHNGPMPVIRVPDVQVEMVEFDDRLIRLDLEFDVWWSGSRLEGFIVHNTALFDEADILKLTERYQVLLERLTRSPESDVLAASDSVAADF